VKTKVLSVVDYGVFVRVRDGVEGLIPQNEVVLPKDESGAEHQLKPGEGLDAEVANIDTQERRITLSMRMGESAAAAAVEAKPARTPSKTPKRTAAAEAAGGTIGELIKQKLGSKLAGISPEADVSGRSPSGRTADRSEGETTKKEDEPKSE
jgi:small subunit ribosomal protein S1